MTPIPRNAHPEIPVLVLHAALSVALAFETAGLPIGAEAVTDELVDSLDQHCNRSVQSICLR